MHPHFYSAMKVSQASYDFISRSLIMPMAATTAAVAIDACRCRWEICRRKHFRFRQKYRTHPQASAEGEYPILPSVASAADAFTGVSMCLQSRLCCPHLWTRPQMYAYMRSNVLTRTCPRTRSWMRLCAFTDVLVCTSLLCYLHRFLLLSPANVGREGEKSWLSHRCLERQVGQFGSWNLTCASSSSNSYKILQQSKCY